MALLLTATLPRIQHALRRLASRRRREHALAVALASLTVLGGGWAVAFAVAPLAPDAARLPRTVVTRIVETDPVAPQLEALAGLDLDLWRSETSRPGDTAALVLARLGVQDAGAQAFVGQDPLMRRALDGRSTRLVSARVSSRGALLELVVRAPADRIESARTHFKRTTMKLEEGVWRSRSESAPLQADVRMVSGQLSSTYEAALDEARVPDAAVRQLSDIFSGDIDFHRTLRRGDRFSLVYEAVSADGQAVPWSQGVGRVLAAEVVAGGRPHQAVWFESAPGKGAYFDPSGRSRQRTFLASPLEFSRLTSGFALRLDPFGRSWRQHLGVDYSAPHGTPVRTVGDGIVESVGWQSGYGQMVVVRHDATRTTVYAHLSRADVNRGQRVDKGQQIGLVGATGWATGPHLHFEFRVNGVHQDPQWVARAAEPLELPAASQDVFAEVARTARARLTLAESVGGSRATFE